ncbi:MAG: DNA-binding protein, partial [Actinomycetia bacterium]|nr:DNA-binding protein [Actinomycetes bacterium]
MQKLHLVGFTADFDGLIFSTRKGAKSGSFVVPLDGRLMKQIAEAERLRGGGPVRVDEHRLNSPRLVRPESALNPREMQDRIRSGWSLDEVAAEAGVDLDWVRRFAAPVLAEVGRVVERSRVAVYDKPRVGPSSLPLGAAVRRNVLERGVRLLDEEVEEAWSAYQLDEDVWVVRFAYTSRGRLQEAEWLYDVETEELSSHNRLAALLGHVTHRRKRSTNPAPVSTVPKPSKATTKAARAASRPSPPRPASRPGPKPSAKPVVKRTSTPRKAAAKKAAAAKRTPVKKAAVKKAAVKKTAVKKTPVKKTPVKKAVVKKAAVKKAVFKK